MEITVLQTAISRVLSIIVLVLIIIVSVKLFIRMRETKLSNLKWLLGIFICQALIGPTKISGIEIAFYTVEIISLFLIIIYTRETFYKDRKSFFKIVCILLLSLTVIIIPLVIFREVNPTAFYLLDAYLLSISIMTSSLWLASSAFSSYELIKDDKVDKDIKLRYILVIIAALSITIQGFLTPILVINETVIQIEDISTFLTILNVVTLLIFALSCFFAWVILGKKIEQSREEDLEEEISEDEMMKMIAEGTLDD